MSSSFLETPHYLPLSDGPRLAIETHSTTGSNGLGVLLCGGGWYSGSSSFNRLFVRIAHTLAQRGVRVVRFDWYGSGESPGHLVRFDLHRPMPEDVLGAASLLKSCHTVVVVGVCFGAASLLAAAPRIEHLKGAIFVSAMVPGHGGRARATKASTPTVLRSALRGDVLKGWANPYTRRLYVKWVRTKLRWRSRKPQSAAPTARIEQFENEVTALSKEVVTHFLYGEGDKSLGAFSTEPLASLTRAGAVGLEVLPFDIEGSGTVEILDEVHQSIVALVSKVTEQPSDLKDAARH